MLPLIIADVAASRIRAFTLAAILITPPFFIIIDTSIAACIFSPLSFDAAVTPRC